MTATDDANIRTEQIAQARRDLPPSRHGFPDGVARPIGGLAEAARTALIVFVVAVVAQTGILGAYYLYPSILPEIFFDWGGGGFNAGYLFDIAYAGAALTAFIIVGKFSFRAMKNLFTLGSPHTEMPPGWTIGWYFVPIASLWQPVMGMNQIYKGSFAAVGEKPRGAPLGTWWGGWLLMGVPEWFMAVWADSYVAQFALSCATAAFACATALTLRLIIGRVAECQALFERGGVATVFE